MTPKRPSSLRLLTRAAGKPPAPPFRLRAWSPADDAASDVAVLADGRGHEPFTAAVLAAQIPDASEVPSGRRVYVLGGAAPVRSFWNPLARRAGVPRVARCSALVARGYVDVGAGVDPDGADLAWGTSP